MVCQTTKSNQNDRLIMIQLFGTLSQQSPLQKKINLERFEVYCNGDCVRQDRFADGQIKDCTILPQRDFLKAKMKFLSFPCRNNFVNACNFTIPRYNKQNGEDHFSFFHWKFIQFLVVTNKRSSVMQLLLLRKFGSILVLCSVLMLELTPNYLNEHDHWFPFFSSYFPCLNFKRQEWAACFILNSISYPNNLVVCIYLFFLLKMVRWRKPNHFIGRNAKWKEKHW